MWFFSNFIVSPASDPNVSPTAMFIDEYQGQNEDNEDKDDHCDDHYGKPRVGDIKGVLVIVMMASPVA